MKKGTFLRIKTTVILHRKQKHRLKMRKIYYVFVSLIILTTMLSCNNKQPRIKPIPMVKMDTLQSFGQGGTLQLPGRVKASHEVSLSFRVPGTIQSISVTEGTQVRKGQLLAALEPTDYQLQLDATRAQYEQVKAEAERIIALYNEHVVTPNDYDKAVAGLKQITAQYKNHQDQLAYTKIYAPFDGVVQKCRFEKHEVVGAGMPVISIIGKGVPEVEINLPASAYIRRNDFDNFYCIVDLYPKKKFPLKLNSVAPQANANQLYNARLSFQETDNPLPDPGMNVMVNIEYREGENAELTVATQAVFRQKDRCFIYRYDPIAGCVYKVEVKMLRLLSNGRSLINSSELKVGDVVVASGVHYIHDNEKVNPLPSPSATNVGGLL